MRFLPFFLIFPLTLSAATITSPCSGTTTTVTAASPVGSINVTCGQFDPALGSLTRAILYSFFGARGNTNTVTLRNDDVVPQFTPYEFTHRVVGVVRPAVTFPGATQASLGSGPITTPNIVIPPGVTTTRAIGGSFALSQITVGPDRSAFIGPGTTTFPIAFASSPQLDVNVVLLDYSLEYGLEDRGNYVAYFYDPVPEPSTWAAGGFALLAMVWRRRAM